MKPKQKTAVLYARYSSDLQKDRSIDDQFALCERYAKREDIKIVKKFSDRAKSGSTLYDRDGLLELMAAAKRREFGAVIVESLDRLSRDQEDLAGLFKRLTHYEIDLLTVNEGLATRIHVGVRGITNSLFIEDLIGKIKRGQSGRVLEGNMPGVVTYGYDRVLGKPGERVINQDHAKIIRRIFTEYANGTSPRAIASGLTRDHIPTPAGGTEWNHQCFVSGGGIKKGGMLGNRLYIGELIWNKHQTTKDPDNHDREVRRERPQSDHITVAVPHLRIIDQKLWEAAQAVRAGRSWSRFGGAIVRRPVIARSPHLLSGLLRCGVCNGNMIISKMSGGKQYVVCSVAHQRSTCSHRKTYIMDTLKDTVLDGMRDNLTDPEAIARAARVFHVEYEAQAKKDAVERLTVEKQRNRLVVQIDRLVHAISDSDEPLPALMTALKAKETERVGLEERLRQINATGNVVTLHPNVMANYRTTVESMHHSLMLDPSKPENRHAFHNLIDHIVVHPTPYRERYEVSVFGRLSAVMGVDLFPTMRTNREILQSEGVSCGDNVNQG